MCGFGLECGGGDGSKLQVELSSDESDEAWPTGRRTKASGGRASVSFLLDLVVLRTQGDGRIWYGIRI